HWYSHQYSMTPMPWAMFFHRGYAVHGTMEAYNLGHAASHGCVRLRPDNAAILFSLVRHQGTRNTTMVVMNGPLPAAPGATPMADAGKDKAPVKQAVEQTPATKHFAKALDDIDVPQNLSAKAYQARTHRDAGIQREGPAVIKHVTRRGSDAAVYRVSAGSDEAKVLRERQAWLRSLDRKYGIVR
ncbi:MAG: L,D-transpeptidase, partial [Candidatus Binataceae bacterium]